MASAINAISRSTLDISKILRRHLLEHVLLHALAKWRDRCISRQSIHDKFLLLKELHGQITASTRSRPMPVAPSQNEAPSPRSGFVHGRLAAVVGSTSAATSPASAESAGTIWPGLFQARSTQALDVPGTVLSPYQWVIFLDPVDAEIRL